MALQRVVIDGYGQLELNAVAFRRSGRIEAQCALDATDFKEVPAENGMLLAVDNVNRVVKFAKDGNIYPIALNYTTEHMYDERHNALKDFKLEVGSFYPRMGYIGMGDKYTTNCLAYDTTDFANEEALMTALDNIKTLLCMQRLAQMALIRSLRVLPMQSLWLLLRLLCLTVSSLSSSRLYN